VQFIITLIQREREFFQKKDWKPDVGIQKRREPRENRSRKERNNLQEKKIAEGQNGGKNMEGKAHEGKVRKVQQYPEEKGWKKREEEAKKKENLETSEK